MAWRRIRRWTVTLGLISILLGATGSWIAGGRLVAPAQRDVGPPPVSLPAAETISIPSQSGARLAGWYVSRAESDATVILVHPYRGDRRAMLGRAKLCLDAGYSVLLIDLQAHGESPGEAITIGFLERHDVAAAVDFVRDRAPGQRIGVIGWSLGGAATVLASPLDVDAVVLESVYPTIDEAVHNRVRQRAGPLHHLLAPILLAQLVPRLGISPGDLRPIDHMDRLECPVLVMAGDRDENTPLKESQRLFAAANEPKELRVFPGAAHVDLLEFDANRYRAAVLPFLKRHLARDKNAVTVVLHSAHLY